MGIATANLRAAARLRAIVRWLRLFVTRFALLLITTLFVSTAEALDQISLQLGS